MGLPAVALAGALLFALWPLAIWIEVDLRLEKPRYNTTLTLPRGVELRTYEAYTVASAQVQGDTLRGSVSRGFIEIAGFIFGKNKNRRTNAPEKISMTAPVSFERDPGRVFSASSPTKGRVSFLMPEKNCANLPTPDSSAVSFRKIPAGNYAVITFSGSPPDESMVEVQANKLRMSLREADLEPVGLPRLDQYHPPFALGFQRRNEVLLRYRGTPAPPKRGSRAFPGMIWENSV